MLNKMITNGTVMEKTVKYLWIMALSLAFLACKETERPIGEELEYVFNFANDEEGWQGGFSDLRAEGHDIFELEYGHSALPEETGVQDNALFIQGHNRSDDLFMFFKREIAGLNPNAMYRVVIDIELASQYPETSVGIGGSPGASVFLKAGAVNYEPRPEVTDEDYLQMNIDKGNQAQDGEDMYNVGTVGIPGEEFRYMLINRGNQERPLDVRASGAGSLWAIVGTDSGFEGLTRLYYNRITVTLQEIF